MGKAVTFTATHEGQVFTRTSRTVTYTHVTLVRLEGEVVDARWSKTPEGALARLPHGWEASRVAVVPCFAPAAPAAPVADEAPATAPVVVLLDLTAPGKGLALVTGGHGFTVEPQAVLGKATAHRWYADSSYGDDGRADYYGTAKTAQAAVRRWLASLGLDAATVTIETRREY